jgi:hypothetical protein
MNSNQRSEGNNQSNNGGNEMDVSSSRAGTADKDNLNQPQQSGTLHGGSMQQGGQAGRPNTNQQGGQQSGQQGSQQTGQQGKPQMDQQGSQQSTDRKGSQTDTSGQRQGMPQERQSNDAAGGMPKSPAGNRQAADQKMDDDTGLSNTANREPSELDQNFRQDRQSNVGRRDDGTPD